MSTVTYPWNPFCDNLNSTITKEVATPFGANSDMIVPKAAPFFARTFKLYKNGNADALVHGKDYLFSLAFPEILTKYKRNCYGKIILLNHIAGDTYEMTYDSIGGPFVLDEIALAELIVNTLNNPRIIYWGQLVNLPTEFPPDPHPQPATLTHDYDEFLIGMTNLASAMSRDTTDSDWSQVLVLMERHLNAINLARAHIASPIDIGLDKVPNLPAAKIDDLTGNSSNLLMTLDVTKVLIRKMIKGELN